MSEFTKGTEDRCSLFTLKDNVAQLYADPVFLRLLYRPQGPEVWDGHLSIDQIHI